MMHLFAPLSSEEQNLIISQKQSKIEAAEFYVFSQGDSIVTQRGDHFVSQENQKYLFLPYLDNELNRQVFVNGEKARTWDAN